MKAMVPAGACTSRRCKALHEVAIDRCAVVIHLAGGAAIGDDEKAAIAKIDAAIVDDVFACGHGRHVHRDDVGPKPADRFAFFGPPKNSGVAPIVDQRHAMVRIAPEEALAVLQIVEVS